jgi:transposase
VIGIFRSIAWKTLPQRTKEQFVEEVKSLGEMLDRAQHRAAELDKRWPSLRKDDLAGANGGPLTAEQWWLAAESNPTAQPERIQVLLRAFAQTKIAMKEAEVPLRKWVVRHLRERTLPDTQVPRRTRLMGRAIALSVVGDGGLPVEEDALLPFLLAARAQAVVVREAEKAGRATFAEGLASSYEAFLETRSNQAERDDEEKEEILGRISKRGNRYLRTLFMQGARVILLRPGNWTKHSFGPWLTAAAKRLHHNVLATALANKLARIAWTVLAQRRNYETRVITAAA